MVDKKTKRGRLRNPGEDKLIEGAKRGASFRSLQKPPEPEPEVTVEAAGRLAGTLREITLHIDPGYLPDTTGMVFVDTETGATSIAMPDGTRRRVATEGSLRMTANATDAAVFAALAMGGGANQQVVMLAEQEIQEREELRLNVDVSTRVSDRALARPSAFQSLNRLRDTLDQMGRVATANLVSGLNATAAQPERARPALSTEDTTRNAVMITDYLRRQQQGIGELTMSMEATDIGFTSGGLHAFDGYNVSQPEITITAQLPGRPRHRAAQLGLAVAALGLSGSATVSHMCRQLEREGLRFSEAHIILSGVDAFFFVWEGERGMVFDGEGGVVRRLVTRARAGRASAASAEALARILR